MRRWPLVAAAAGAAGFLALRRRRPPLQGVALVSGGTRGLGLCLVEALRARGLRVALCARSEPELESVARHLPGVQAFRCDLADPPDIDRLVERVESVLGPVDVLVNNAGIITVGPLETMSVEDYDRAMDVMFWPLVHTVQRVLPGMLARRRGWILNVTSIGGKVSVPHLLPYSCAKAAALAFSEGLRAETAGRGVTVVSGVPGLMRTGSFLQARFKGRREAEATWFSLASSNPLLAMDARRAARKLVRALERGRAEPTLTLPARILARLHGLFPGIVTDAMGLASRVMPRADSGAGPAVRALDLDLQENRLLRALTAPGHRAAAKYQAHHPELG